MSETRIKKVTVNELLAGFEGRGTMRNCIRKRNWSRAALYMEANEENLTDAQKALWDNFKHSQKLR